MAKETVTPAAAAEIDPMKRIHHHELEVRRHQTTIREGNKVGYKVTFEVLHTKRTDVHIEPFRAKQLNEGALSHPANSIFCIYLLPEDKIENYTITAWKDEPPIYSWAAPENY